ncbi:MAG: protein kinase, partial [Planctomycetaceae bacterium]|nr:protein kinase [Planctomycetaceae bacterium]
MNKPNDEHPQLVQLAAFLEGRLSGVQQRAVEQHIEGCRTCCETMDRLPLDPLSAQLRDIETDLNPSESDWSIATDTGIRKSTDAKQPPDVLPDSLQSHPRYRILEPLGKGGMGVVYKAQHRMMDRIVAIKVIDGRLIDHPHMIRRFQNEVKAAAMLTHANIVRAYDAEHAEDLHFLVMEYVDGISLAELIDRKGPLSAEQAMGVIRKVAHGLQHACQHGMVHRDIKPQNIMVTRTGKVRILDFGLARFAREREQDAVPVNANPSDRMRLTADSLTMVGSILGTPDYIAPEQVTDPRSADTRADIYSLGCTCYYLLTGQPPFPAGNTIQKLIAHRDQTPESLRDLRPDISPAVVAIVSCMMARNPEDRFQDPREVATAIDALSSGSQFAEHSGNSTTSGKAGGTVQGAGKLPDIAADRQQSPNDRRSPNTSPSANPLDIHSRNYGTSVRQPSGRRGRRRTTDQKATSAQLVTRKLSAAAAVILLIVGAMYFGRVHSVFDTTSSTEGQLTERTGNSEVHENAETTSSGNSAATSSSEWIDLMPLIDPARDSVAGRWQKSGTELTVDSTVGARLAIPTELPAEYDFEIEFTRLNGIHSVAMIFVSNGCQATFDIDAWAQHIAGIQNINGQTIQPEDPNPTAVADIRLTNGERYTASVRVRKNRIEASLNHRLLSTYRGDGSDLSLIPQWLLPDESTS